MGTDFVSQIVEKLMNVEFSLQLYESGKAKYVHSDVIKEHIPFYKCLEETTTGHDIFNIFR